LFLKGALDKRFRAPELVRSTGAPMVPVHAPWGSLTQDASSQPSTQHLSDCICTRPIALILRAPYTSATQQEHTPIVAPCANDWLTRKSKKEFSMHARTKLQAGSAKLFRVTILAPRPCVCGAGPGETCIFAQAHVWRCASSRPANLQKWCHCTLYKQALP